MSLSESSRDPVDLTGQVAMVTGASAGLGRRFATVLTKAAISRMTEVLAIEWVRHGINVNAIAPGAFMSEMVQHHIERAGDFIDRLPRKRIGNLDQLDSTLLYLASPASEYVTGTIIKVDDGQYPR